VFNNTQRNCLLAICKPCTSRPTAECTTAECNLVLRCTGICLHVQLQPPLRPCTWMVIKDDFLCCTLTAIHACSHSRCSE
jgi:hypothetical protein